MENLTAVLKMAEYKDAECARDTAQYGGPDEYAAAEDDLPIGEDPTIADDYGADLYDDGELYEVEAQDDAAGEQSMEEYVASLTYQDFQSAIRPCQFILNQPNIFDQQRALQMVIEQAKKVKFSGFRAIYRAFEETTKKTAQQYRQSGGNTTNFYHAPCQLLCGEWIADETGVYREGEHGKEIACSHPILLVQRLENADSREEKVVIAFKRHKNAVWKHIVVDKITIASAHKIVELSTHGVLVTSENARSLVCYLADLDALNYLSIPVGHSISRLGWFDGCGFAPYVKNLVLDTESGFRSLYDSIREQGDFQEWKKAVVDAIAYRTEVKILLCASFAAPLVHALGILCFFVHLWGVRSGSGKSVALRLAASVWGDSRPGAYVRSFDSTAVGMEKISEFLNQLPVCLDELQLTRDRNGQTRIDPYKLAEGVGRTRGTKSGGVSKTGKWETIFLTTGESPMNGENAAAGAVNRVIDVKCYGEDSIIRDCAYVCEVIARSFGHAGRMFIEHLYKGGSVDPAVQTTYTHFLRELRKTDVSEKQMVSAAAILAASELANKWVFDGTAESLTVAEILPYLAKMQDVSIGPRAYNYLIQWISVNIRHFNKEDKNVDLYGDYKADEGVCYINRNKFDEAIKEGSFDEQAILTYLRDAGLLALKLGRKERGYTVTHYIYNGLAPRCVPLRMPNNVEPTVPTDEYGVELPL